MKWWKKWWSETCCPVCFIPFSCCWGLWAAADAVSGSPSVFSLSFPGSFEFWRSFEYRGCRASSAWQGESVLYFRQLVPKQAHILYSALPSQFLLECWSCCSRYWVTHWISSQIFKQKGLSLGKQTAHSMLVTICWACGPQCGHSPKRDDLIDDLSLLVAEISLKLCMCCASWWWAGLAWWRGWPWP